MNEKKTYFIDDGTQLCTRGGKTADAVIEELKKPKNQDKREQ